MNAIKINKLPNSALKNARINAGYSSAREFAEKHNLPKATYYQHESGKRHPKLNILQQYCALLDVDIEILMGAPLFRQKKKSSSQPKGDCNLLKKRLVMSANSNLAPISRTGQREKLLEHIENEFSILLNKNNISLSRNKLRKNCEHACENLMRCTGIYAHQKKILDIVFYLLGPLAQASRKTNSQEHKK